MEGSHRYSEQDWTVLLSIKVNDLVIAIHTHTHYSIVLKCRTNAIFCVYLGSVEEGGHAGANWVRRSITINTGFGDRRFRDGNIEELLIHEGAHVSLDNYHKDVCN